MKAEQILNTIAVRQDGVFSLDQALECGLRRQAIDWRVRERRLTRIHAGVFVVAGTLFSYRVKLRGALLAAGGLAYVSHRAAANLLELGELSQVIEISVPWEQNPALPENVIVHRVRALPADDIILFAGFRVTTSQRTILDLAGTLAPDDLEQILDRALAKRDVSHAALVSCLARAGRGRRGAAALRALLDERPEGKARVRSPLEKRVHRLLQSAGITGWTPNLDVQLPCGRHVILDVAFPRPRVAIEVDGYVFHASATAWASDHERRNAIVAAGWRIIALTSRGLDGDPGAAIATVRGALGA